MKPTSAKHRCVVKDDKGVMCNAPVSVRQWEQDGMCGNCADHLWEWHQDMNKRLVFVVKARRKRLTLVD